MSTGITIAGQCPMGCGRTLFIGAGGFVTCSHSRCTRPDAVARLLDEGESEHVVVLRKRDFTIRHPLRERLDGELEACDVHQRITQLSGPPRVPGTYRVYVNGDESWIWSPLVSS